RSRLTFFERRRRSGERRWLSEHLPATRTRRDRGGHWGGYIARDIATVTRYLSHQARTHELQLGSRDQKYGLDLRRQIAVHQAHLEFDLEIAHRTEPAHDRARADFAAKLDDEPSEGGCADAGEMGEGLLDEPAALLSRKIASL